MLLKELLMKNLLRLLLAATVLGNLISCKPRDERLRVSTSDSVAMVRDNLAHRAAVEDFMKGPDSPFGRLMGKSASAAAKGPRRAVESVRAPQAVWESVAV